jgi:serine/threonine-protein kinase
VFCDTIKNYLVCDEHRGIFVHEGKIHSISKVNRRVRVRFDGVGGIVVVYNGVNFEVVDVEGDVYINNRGAFTGSVLHNACLLTFGRPGQKRYWVTFSSSHPEVIL